MKQCYQWASSVWACKGSVLALQAGDSLKAKVNQAGKKVQNAVGGVAGLPSPQEAADKLKGKVDEVGRNVQGVGSNNPLSGNIPSPQEVRVCGVP